MSWNLNVWTQNAKIFTVTVFGYMPRDIFLFFIFNKWEMLTCALYQNRNYLLEIVSNYFSKS